MHRLCNTLVFSRKENSGYTYYGFSVTNKNDLFSRNLDQCFPTRDPLITREQFGCVGEILKWKMGRF